MRIKLINNPICNNIRNRIFQLCNRKFQLCNRKILLRNYRNGKVWSVLPRPQLAKWSFQYMPPPLNRRSRSWCFTLNNYTADEESMVQALGRQVKFLIYGREVGTQGVPHLQGYVYLKERKSLNVMKKLVPRAHFEICRGSAKENIEYCSKSNDTWTSGTPPKGSGPMIERAERNQLLLTTPILDLVNNGDISILTVPSLEKARGILSRATTPTTRTNTCGLWIYGPPGTGKTHYARTLFSESDIYIKAQNKWWDGYQQQDVVLLDDLDTSTLGHYLKIWTDKWPCTGEIKGGTVSLAHRHFVITSNYTPEQLWHEDPVLAAAVSRRCTFKHKYKL